MRKRDRITGFVQRQNNANDINTYTNGEGAMRFGGLYDKTNGGHLGSGHNVSYRRVTYKQLTYEFVPSLPYFYYQTVLVR